MEVKTLLMQLSVPLPTEPVATRFRELRSNCGTRDTLCATPVSIASATKNVVAGGWAE